jgi:N6-adenosine-specific RNA methylase IME4
MEDDSNTALVEINKAQQALERANDIHEILDLRDKAAAFQLFANAQGFKEAAQEAKIFQLKAERKAGQWLEDNIDHKGGNPQLLQDVIVRGLPEGVEPIESHRYQLEASVPEEQFSEWVDDCLSTGKEISAAGLQRIGKEIKREEQIEEIKQSILIAPPGTFEVIVIDPPWPYETEYDPFGRRAANPYPEQSLEEIAKMEIPSSGDCVLWLWTTHKFMRHAFVLLDTWGYRDVAILTWVKDRMGLGSWLRSQSEFCIMAVKGKPVVNLTNQTTVIHAPMREHSRKPDEFYKMVDDLCIGRKLDFYSREARKGWEQYGNELAKFDQR